MAHRQVARVPLSPLPRNDDVCFSPMLVPEVFEIQMRASFAVSTSPPRLAAQMKHNSINQANSFPEKNPPTPALAAAAERMRPPI